MRATIPTGRTERDPYRRAKAGLRHRHLQLGTGTLDPLLEAAYRGPLGPRFDAAITALARASLYRNAKGYRGPPELPLGLTLSWRASATWSIDAGYALMGQL